MRPSTITSSLFAYWPLKPREEMDHWLDLIGPTCMPGAKRRASASEVVPDRWRSSAVRTAIAAVASLKFCAFLDTFTGRLMNCSMLKSATLEALTAADNGMANERERDGMSGPFHLNSLLWLIFNIAKTSTKPLD